MAPERLCINLVKFNDNTYKGITVIDKYIGINVISIKLYKVVTKLAAIIKNPPRNRIFKYENRN
jgi:hypothetical protein